MRHTTQPIQLCLIPYPLYPVPYTLYPMPHTRVYRIPYTLYPIPYTPYLIPYTLYLVPCTVYHIPYTGYPVYPPDKPLQQQMFVCTNIYRTQRNTCFMTRVRPTIRGEDTPSPLLMGANRYHRKAFIEIRSRWFRMRHPFHH